MKKGLLLVVSVVVLLLGSLVVAQEDCNLFCQAGQWWDGLFSSEEALAGKAGEGDG